MDDEPARPVAPVRPRRSLLKFGLLAAGLGVAAYFGGKAPRDQHVTLVLGPGSERVIGLEIQYIGADGELARDARMAFEAGAAPRVVSHQPHLADGDYSLRIDLDTREGRRSAERRVTLGGGTTKIDLAGALGPAR
ncbi:hypothetical protein BH11MYX4_BH11MYX4_08160 [soil metagenome]